MSAATIPLMGQAPQIASPLQTAGSLMQLRGQMGELALRQAQMQDIQAQAQQRNKDISDQNTLQQLMGDPETAKAIGNGDFSALNGKIQPKNLTAFQNAILESQQKRATLNKDQLELATKAHDNIEQGLAGLQSLPSDADRLQQMHSLYGQWQQAGYLKDLPNAAQLIQQYDGSADSTTKFAAANGLLYGLTQKAAAIRKEQTDAAEKEAETTKNIAESGKANEATRGEKLKNDLLQNAISSLQANPQSGTDTIHKMFNPSDTGSLDPVAENGYIQGMMAAGRSADPLEAQKSILNAAAAHVAGIGTATSPTVRAGKVAEAVATEQATQPFKTKAAEVLASYGHGLQEQSTAAKQLQEGLADYYQSTASAGAIKQAIQMARDGNQVAASQVPGLAAALQMAMFDIKRLPANAVSGMGSAQDKIANAYDSLVHNQPVNWGELNQLPAYIDTITSAAANRYNGVAKSVEQAYTGVKAPRVAVPEASAAAPSVGPKRITTKAEFDALKSGDQYIDPQDGKAYRKP